MSKIAIISGSHRPNSQSAKVADYIAKALSTKGQETSLRDLGKEPLPFWDESMWGMEGVAKEAWADLSEELKSADALVVIAPEWNGMAPAALHNFFLYASMAELAHKPALLVGVSASANGVYPVAELRSFSSKNCKLVYVPDHVVVKDVNNVLNDGASVSDDDTFIREKMDYSLDLLIEYAKALVSVRASGKQQTEKFVFGQ